MKVHIPSLITSCQSVNASLCIIYIEEAHAQDEWPIRSATQTVDGKPILYNKAIVLDDRLIAAQDFKRDYNVDSSKCNLVVDHIDNGFQNLYASWPIRWYVLSASSGLADAKVTLNHIGQPDNAAFDFRVLKRILTRASSSTTLSSSSSTTTTTTST